MEAPPKLDYSWGSRAFEGARLQPCRNLLPFMVALATEGLRVEANCDFPQGLKPNSSRSQRHG
jgi:hypothetical protein